MPASKDTPSKSGVPENDLERFSAESVVDLTVSIDDTIAPELEKRPTGRYHAAASAAPSLEAAPVPQQVYDQPISHIR